MLFAVSEYIFCGFAVLGHFSCRFAVFRPLFCGLAVFRVFFCGFAVSATPITLPGNASIHILNQPLLPQSCQEVPKSSRSPSFFLCRVDFICNICNFYGTRTGFIFQKTYFTPISYIFKWMINTFFGLTLFQVKVRKNFLFRLLYLSKYVQEILFCQNVEATVQSTSPLWICCTLFIVFGNYICDYVIMCR